MIKKMLSKNKNKRRLVYFNLNKEQTKDENTKQENVQSNQKVTNDTNTLKESL